MVVTATQLKIKGLFGFFRFFVQVQKVKTQLKNQKGLLSAKFRGFSTLTVWESYDDMRSFRNNGHHLDAMKNVGNIGMAKSVTWETDTEPDWDEAIRRLDTIKL